LEVGLVNDILVVYRAFCLKRKAILCYTIWGLIIANTLSGVGLRIAKIDVRYFLICLLALLSFFILLGIRIRNVKVWLPIILPVFFIALFNAFSAFANTGSTSFLKMVFNGSVQIAVYTLVVIAIYELSDGKVMKNILSALVIVAALQSLLSIFSVTFSNELNVFSRFSVQSGANYRAKGFFSDSRTFSIFLTVTLLVTIYLFIQRFMTLYKSKKSNAVLLELV
jgi:hypothetical protein